MKNYILTITLLLFLISCGKNEKQIEPEKLQDTIADNPKETEIKEVEIPIYNYEKDSDFSKELDLVLLAKVASNLGIKYEDVKIDETGSVNYDDKTSFFVITYIAEKWKPGDENWDENDGDFIERMYVFVNKSSGKILDKEIDKNLCVYEHEGLEVYTTYIFKKLIQLNETTNGIGLSTELGISSRVVLSADQKFTIITLVDNKIKKILYEYPIRKVGGDSNGGGSFEKESLETSISISKKKTNGFFDLNVVKTFSHEEEVEEDLEEGIKGKVAPIKIKKESERIQYNGKIYSFKIDDKYRFLKKYN
ncbi:MAG TPA: hypothetical protein VIV55_10470 [Flavobacterium sp.]